MALKVDCALPHAVRQRFDAQKVLFVCIKKLNFVEKSNYHGRLEQGVYVEESAALLQRIEDLTQKIPGYSLESFLAAFALQGEIYAVDRIGRNKDGRRQPLIEASFLARDLLDLLLVYKQDPRAGHFRAEYKNLAERLELLPAGIAARLQAELAAFRADQAGIEARGLSERLGEPEYEAASFNMEQLYKALYNAVLK